MNAQVRHIWAFGWSLAIVSVLSSLLVVLKQLHAPTKAWMAAATGHHWITHGLIALILFVVVGVVLSKMVRVNSSAALDGLAATIAASTVVSGLILAGFFLLE